MNNSEHIGNVRTICKNTGFTIEGMMFMGFGRIRVDIQRPTRASEFGTVYLSRPEVFQVVQDAATSLLLNYCVAPATDFRGEIDGLIFSWDGEE